MTQKTTMNDDPSTASHQFLDLHSLSRDFRPGITELAGAYMAEAAAVCLDSQKHKNEVLMTVTGHFSVLYRLLFGKVDDRTRRTHGDPEVATEYGAYGIAIMIVERNTELTAIERSRKGTGIDYWLGIGESDEPFQKKARLEVSGIRSGSDNAVNSRVNTKIKQTMRSEGSLPSYVVVVEFGKPKAKVVLR